MEPNLELLEFVECDAEYYRTQNSDLTSMTATDLHRHYAVHGYLEGRIAHPLCIRANLLGQVQLASSILEIGPFCNPCVTGPNVRYFDVLDREALLVRAHAHQQPIQNVPERIHYISPVGDLSIVEDRFEVLVSSHCIEHQPNLIAHLRYAGKILTDEGKYYLILPDKRYCFDSFISPSNIAEVLQADFENRNLHTLASVIETRALASHNDAELHWRGEHGDVNIQDIAERTKRAIQEYEDSKGSYIDVHAWQFTPLSFSMILNALFELGKSPFSSVRVFGTPHNQLEFCAVLSKHG